MGVPPSAAGYPPQTYSLRSYSATIPNAATQNKGNLGVINKFITITHKPTLGIPLAHAQGAHIPTHKNNVNKYVDKKNKYEITEIKKSIYLQSNIKKQKLKGGIKK